MSGSSPVHRMTRRVASVLAVAGLLSGMLAIATGPTLATSLMVSVSSSVSGATASLAITVNRQPKAIAACGYVLDSESTVDCGTPSTSTKTSTTFEVALSGLSSGDHTVTVSVRLTDHGAAAGSTSFSVSLAACQVMNERTGDRYEGTGVNLQAAIDASVLGDTLDVQGRCVGNFRLTTKTLTLVGKAMDGYPVATLDGNGSGHVVLLDLCPPPNPTCPTDITLTDLLITNGYFGGTTLNDVGGGIYNNHAVLTLNGSTEVSGNHAAYGGGIASYGTITINDSARVVGNTAALDGGGIYDFGGLLTVNDDAQVTGNTAGGSGGGIYQYGGTLTLDGTAQVTRNTAGATGGGIFNFGTFYACNTWTGAMSPNTPDDPPSPTQVSC